MSQLFLIHENVQSKMLKMIERFFLKQGIDYHVQERVKAKKIDIEGLKPIKFGNYTLNPRTRKLTHKGKKIYLKKKEFELLHFMFLNRKSIMDRNTVLDRVWGLKSNPFTNTVDVHISHLRRILLQNGVDIIKTIHGVGYKLEI